MDAQGLTSPQRKLAMWYKVKDLKSKGLKNVQIGRELDLHHKPNRIATPIRQLTQISQYRRLFHNSPASASTTLKEEITENSDGKTAKP